VAAAGWRGQLALLPSQGAGGGAAAAGTVVGLGGGSESDDSDGEAGGRLSSLDKTSDNRY
jgi:hypothetical protein